MPLSRRMIPMGKVRKCRVKASPLVGPPLCARPAPYATVVASPRMSTKDTPPVACPRCGSQFLHALTRTIGMQYYRCKECAHVFCVDLPEPPPPRERRSDPARRRKP